MIFAQSLVTFLALLLSLFTAATHGLPTTSTHPATVPTTKSSLTGPRSLLGRTTYLRARAEALPEDFMGITRDGPMGRADRFRAVHARRSALAFPEDFIGVARDGPAGHAVALEARFSQESHGELSSTRSPSTTIQGRENEATHDGEMVDRSAMWENTIAA